MQKGHVCGPQAESSAGIALMPRAANGVVTFVFIFQHSGMEIQVARHQLRFKQINQLSARQSGVCKMRIAPGFREPLREHKLGKILIDDFCAIEHLSKCSRGLDRKATKRCDRAWLHMNI